MTDRGFEGERRDGNVWLEVIGGFCLVMLAHTFVGGCLGGIGALATQAPPGQNRDLPMAVGMMWMFGIGVTQLAYVMPMFVLALFVRRNVAAGIALGALITFLLNGACFGVLCATM